MGQVVIFALLSAVNPTLLAATTVMLLLPHPERLLLGYWLGAMAMSVTVGLVVIFALQGSGVVSTTKKTLSPLADFVLAAILLIAAVAVATGRHGRAKKKREQRKANGGEAKKTPKWQQEISKGTAKTTFVVGALLSLPGATYLAGLDSISKLHYSTAIAVLLVVGFCVVQLLLIEIPMLAFKVWPAQTPVAIEHAKDWGRAHGREYAAWGLAVIGVALAIKGVTAT